MIFRIGRILVQIPLGARQGFVTQPHYKAPGDLEVDISKCSDYCHVSEVVPSTVAQNWPWGSHIAIKKYVFHDDIKNYPQIFSHECLCRLAEYGIHIGVW